MAYSPRQTYVLHSIHPPEYNTWACRVTNFCLSLSKSFLPALQQMRTWDKSKGCWERFVLCDRLIHLPPTMESSGVILSHLVTLPCPPNPHFLFCFFHFAVFFLPSNLLFLPHFSPTKHPLGFITPCSSTWINSLNELLSESWTRSSLAKDVL